MDGSRARIGYTTATAAAETFPYEFYRIVPKGVTLVLTTMSIVEMSQAEIDQSYDINHRASGRLARSNVDVVVFGGLPVNAAKGFDTIEAMATKLSADIGKPATTSFAAQTEALAAVGARRVAVAHPFDAGQDALFAATLKHVGLDIAGVKGAGRKAVDLGQISLDAVVETARAAIAIDPRADTLWLPCSHWAVCEAIDRLESELRVNVIAASQAIIWKALRMCGVNDKLQDVGRLLREF
jgi:maleate isomerase